MASASLHVRAYRRDDLGRVVSLWEESGYTPVGPDGLSVDEALDTMHADGAVALVAEDRGDVCGMAVGARSGAVGTVYRIAARGPDVGGTTGRLLEVMESRLAEAGARKLVTWVVDRGGLGDLLSANGYRPCLDLAAVSRELAGASGASVLQQLGGRMIEAGLWAGLEGMEAVKDVIERRVILPLAEPALAERHGVAQPKAVVLFGPPGAGKTTFAKGIASRLRWPFVEVVPAELAAAGAAASELAHTFDAVMELEAAVVFVDEVEDLASMRQADRRVDPKVTNEFLKQIPRLRGTPRRLLVCATNQIGRLDPAFIRPGRFDYLLPVGPPGPDARAAIWHRYAREITDEPVDLDAIVEASPLFTPADIEFAARKAAQIAFEREHFEAVGRRATTEDFLTAIRELRPTLTEEMIRTFEQDVEEFSRH